MTPRENTEARGDGDVASEGAPTLEEQDWEAIESGAIAPRTIPENGDIRYPEPVGEAPEEDDDNAYQESDEALPDDAEEAAIDRRPSREGGRFDEI